MTRCARGSSSLSGRERQDASSRMSRYWPDDDLGAHPGELAAGGLAGGAVAGSRGSPSSNSSSLQPSSRSPSSSAAEVPKAAARRRPSPCRGVQRLEALVRGGRAAAQVGVVHDVVVHEGGGVEELERRRDGHDGGQRARLRGGLGVRVGSNSSPDGGDRLPAPVAEQRAEAFAAGEEAACGRRRARRRSGEISRESASRAPRRSRRCAVVRDRLTAYSQPRA